jgi:hypothetical protein
MLHIPLRSSWSILHLYFILLNMLTISAQRLLRMTIRRMMALCNSREVSNMIPLIFSAAPRYLLRHV